MNLYPVILIAVTLGGIGVSLWGWRVLKQAQLTRQWPQTTGMIETSEPGSEHDDLLPHIVYRYRIGNEEYRAPFRFPEGTNPMPEFAASYLKKYPVGAEVTVFYNPEQPQDSTLEPAARGDWMILALGILMLAGGAISLLASW